MRRPLVIVGCGGFGREVLHIVEALNRHALDRHRPEWAVEGFVDDHPDETDLKRVAALGHAYLGTVADLSARGDEFAVVVAIGSPQARARVVARLDALAVSPGRLASPPTVTFPVLVHPDATICPDAVLGAGSVLAAGVRVNTNVTLGQHVHVDQNATVGHDCRIADFARLNPQACVSGAVTVGARALVGANATVLQGLTVGSDAVVGAAACVVRDVAAAATVKGVPAR